MKREYRAYDIEVFRYDWLIVIKNLDGTTAGIFHNDNTGLLELVKSSTLISFNGYFYDDYILTAILSGWSNYQIKDLNDRIIKGERQKKVHPDIDSLDTFQQIDVSMPSLKKIEGNLGMSIVESEIDFNIDRPLTREEMQETIFYCSHDVDATIRVWKLRLKSYFEPKMMLLEMLPPNKKKYAKRWNTTTIGANILTNKPFPKWFDVRLGGRGKDGNYKIMKLAPPEAKNLWREKKTGTYSHKEMGCIIDFAFGGLHGVANPCNKMYRNVKLLDVASLYPNIILRLNALNSATGIYRGVVETRLSVKHTNKKLSDGLKLFINSCYGLLNNEYSVLFNPKASLSVCIYGQLILYDLCQRLAETCKIININTDGVAFINENDEYQRVWKEWESDYGFVLEMDEYTLFIQKNVNNYIAVAVDDGKDYLKCKGGDVGRYGGPTPFKNNNTRIVDIAIVDKLVYGVDVLDTIMKNMGKPELFQYILKAGNTYDCTVDQNGKEYQKVNRVFASKEGGVCLKKKRIDGGLVHFQNAPLNMLVYNDDVNNIDPVKFEKMLDINFYYGLINHTLEQWL